ncbi:bacteriohemerythrin [Telmatospirillum siberiense]|uniref:Hemerythrin-like domain-containing protein n=1 Tax=Telmatospirillum siberiense TaxID=382514 RepID=A0A2N3PYS6_9PROT|nr:bacteriohemerythrin [Telmatospirillum siberiense]PKU25574.1 hypothetical protein CWS72_05800 [Telmatospirillum siberiense]
MVAGTIAKWSSDMSVGVLVLDEEHRFLIEEMNSLHAIKKMKSQDTLENCLGRLICFAIKHFFHEESYMAKMRYSRMPAHKVAHDDFIVKMQSFLRRGADEDVTVLSVEIVEYLDEWCAQHILVEDRRYALEADSRSGQDRMWGGGRSR